MVKEALKLVSTASLAMGLLAAGCDSRLSQVAIPVPSRVGGLKAPGVVEKIEVIAGNNQATIQWSKPPLSIEGSISDYLIEYSSDNGISWILFDDGVSSNTEATVTGLNNGAAYRFRVAAVNLAGRSAFAETISDAVPFGLPGAPITLEGITGNAQVTLTWAKPNSDGGRAIIDYVVEYSSDISQTWITFDDGISTNPGATVTGLTNGASYRFRVAAANLAGRSAFAETISDAVPFGLPGAPITLEGITGNAQVTLTWAKPNSDGGRAIIDYVVEYSSDISQTWITFDDGISTNPGATVTGLTNGASYRFRVAAVNPAGRSAFAETMSGLMPVGAPGVPINLIGTQGNTKVTLTWTRPTSDGGRGISDYVVEYSSDAGQTWMVFDDGISTNPGATVTGLTNGASYRFRVAAVNEVGTGDVQILPSSLSPQISPPDAPSGVTIQLASPGVSSTFADMVLINWAKPLDEGGSPVTGYQVQYSVAGGGGWISRATQTTMSAVINLDVPNTTYNFRIAAINSIGAGDFVYLTAKSTLRVPSAPTLITVTPADKRATLVWQPPVKPGGDSFVKYIIEYSSDYGKTWVRFDKDVGENLTFTVDGLVNLRDYSFRVAGQNSAGQGSFSTIMSARLWDYCEGQENGHTETRPGFTKFIVPYGKTCEPTTTQRVCNSGVFSPWTGPSSCSVLSRSESALTKIDLQAVAAAYNKFVPQYLKDEFDRYRPATFSTTDLNLFSTYDSSLKQAVWSQNYLFSFDFSGHHWETEDNAAQAGTLITSQHLAHAAHWPLPVGKRVYFYTKEGISVVRTIKEVKGANVDPTKQFGGDIAIAKLDSPVPDHIMVYPVLAPYADNESLNRDLSKAPYLMLNNNIWMRPNDTRKVHWNEISNIWPATGAGASTGWMSISGTLKLDVPAFVNLTNITGDSGKPNFIVVEGMLVLMSTNTYAGYGSGPFYGAKASQDYIVNTTIPSFAP